MTHYLVFVVLEYALIAGACYLATLSPWLWPVALAIVGTRQHALAVLGHDGAHFTVARRRRLNDSLTWLTLWPLGMGLDGYRRFHFGHHSHVGTPRDPELVHKHLFWDKWSPRNVFPARRAQLLLPDLCGAGVLELVTVLLVARPISRADRLGPPLTIGTLAAVLLALGQWQAVVLWFVALCTVFWASFRQRCLEEHCGYAVTMVREERPALWRRVLYLPHHIWKHVDHHAAPATPPRELIGVQSWD